MSILVFTSYATKDAELFKVKEIAEELTKFNDIKDVLYWQEDLYDNIVKYMNDGVGICDVVLLFCTKNANNSVPVEKEWTAAEMLNKPIIPIFINKKDIPPLLTSRLGLEYDPKDSRKIIDKLHKLILKKVAKTKDLNIKVETLKDFEIEKIETSSQIKSDISTRGYSYKIKVLLLGHPDKEKLVQKFGKNRFLANYKLTVGINILSKEVEFKRNEFAVLSIWNIINHNRYEFIRSTFYKGTAGIILVFDLLNVQSYDESRKLLTEIRSYTGVKTPFVLIGINRDLVEEQNEVINRAKIKTFVESNGGLYVETSLALGENIESAFKGLTNRILSLRNS